MCCMTLASMSPLNTALLVSSPTLAIGYVHLKVMVATLPSSSGALDNLRCYGLTCSSKARLAVAPQLTTDRGKEILGMRVLASATIIRAVMQHLWTGPDPCWISDDGSNAVLVRASGRYGFSH